MQRPTGFSGTQLSSVCDYLVWHAKSLSNIKYCSLFDIKEQGSMGASKYRSISSIKALATTCFNPTYLATSDQLTSQGTSINSEQRFQFKGAEWTPPAGLHWKTTVSGLGRLSKADRMILEGKSVRYVRFLDDFSVLHGQMFGLTWEESKVEQTKGVCSANCYRSCQALHPHDHRSRRPCAGSHLRLRYHGLCCRAMGSPLDHH